MGFSKQKLVKFRCTEEYCQDCPAVEAHDLSPIGSKTFVGFPNCVVWSNGDILIEKKVSWSMLPHKIPKCH